MRSVHPGRAGLTLVELAVVLGLLGVVLSTVNSLLQALAGGYRGGLARMETDASGSRAMQRVTAGLRHAFVGSLVGLPESPLYGTTFEVRRSVGFDGTRTLWSAPEHFEYSAAEGVLTWSEGPGGASERTLFRVQGVAPMLTGELPNGIDDNGNGLVDEPGFCATREAELVHIWLTLASQDQDGRPIERTWSTSIRCRN